jgi:hypothetical protein
VTDTWYRIQGVLDISLTSLDNMGQAGVMTIKPDFGLPDQSRTVPEVLYLTVAHFS